MTRYAHITGWGMAVPEKILTNDEIAQFVNTSDEWIKEMTGIRERRIAKPDETTGMLATQAALQAMEVANVRPTEIDMIIVATSSPEHLFPATACLVQDRIGATNCGAFDILAACSGFIYALDIASQAIKTGSIKTALVIGAETLSRLVNWRDRTTCILFGDGAGAFVVQGSDEPGGVLSSMLRSDGSGGDLLSIPAGGSYLPASPHSVGNGLHYIQMNGREVFRFATRVMAKATEQVVETAGLKIGDIQLIVPHQANYRIIEAAAKGLRLPIDRFVINLDRYGNTSTASIPIAVCEAIEAGRLQSDDKIVIVGFGAGLTWGAAAIHWTGPFPSEKKVHPSRYQMLARARSVARKTLRRIEGWIYGRK